MSSIFNEIYLFNPFIYKQVVSLSEPYLSDLTFEKKSDKDLLKREQEKYKGLFSSSKQIKLCFLLVLRW
jgi:hypothetical protein